MKTLDIVVKFRNNTKKVPACWLRQRRSPATRSALWAFLVGGTQWLLLLAGAQLG